jgi:hypothetical protein
VEKEPGQARLLAWMFHRSGYPEQASAIFNASSDTPRGSSQYDSAMSTYTVVGVGVDIWDMVDDFHFAYKRLHGNGSITAKIDSIENVNEWSKAGVMIRSTLEPDSLNAMMLVTPNGRLSFQYRCTDLASTSVLYTPPNSISLPHWVRLTCQGSRFTAQHSGDGVTWQDMLDASGQPPTIEIPIGETGYIGLAVTSHDSAKTAEARISHVTTTGNVSPPGPFTESCDIPRESPPAKYK